MQSYIAGIVAYSISNYYTDINGGAVNIGRILSKNSNYAGGIIAFANNTSASHSMTNVSGFNAGIVDGAINSVGGIAGYIGNNVAVSNCMTTNWVNVGTAQHFGAIVGENYGMITNCYYDEQMCILNGIGSNNNPNTPLPVGLPTTSMLGNNLPIALPGNPPQLYPVFGNHPISLLAAAPIRLQDNPITGDPERLDYVTQDFYVSNNYPLQIYPFIFPFQWGWFNPAFKSFSLNDFVEIQQPNNAVIRIQGGWDTLAVRLINYNYPPYSNYNIVFEKIVPIYVGR
ncbi:MAG: hypothetical protein FWG85_06715 [Bacteroidetes bacterium]|nr:hypothetical protein [Bacteroidota bacterium]